MDRSFDVQFNVDQGNMPTDQGLGNKDETRLRNRLPGDENERRVTSSCKTTYRAQKNILNTKALKTLNTP